MSPQRLTPDVLVVGGGPAGLTAATKLAERFSGQVLVLDREQQAGGIPRHSNHLGYGVLDLHRFLSGPAYARRLVDRAVTAGATIRTEAMVTGWDADGAAEVTTPQGRLNVSAKAVVLATGARERPRSARLVPGDRPRGVYTSGQLQNLVHLLHQSPGTRAVVVGAELVSWSVVATLREAGCQVVLMTTEHASPESYAAFNLVGRYALRTPIATRSRIANIIGSKEIQAVEVEGLDTGARRMVECDTIVFTGDWIPDNELARAAGVTLDPRSLGPCVDTALRTDRPGVFAAGNVVHPVDTADVAALDGRHVATQVARWLDGTRPSQDAVRILAATPLRWVAPGILRRGDPAPARGRLLAWTDERIAHPHVTVSQRGAEVARRRLPSISSPGRVFRIPWGILGDVDFASGDLTIGIRR
jgi:thioredoxin reductase